MSPRTVLKALPAAALFLYLTGALSQPSIAAPPEVEETSSKPEVSAAPGKGLTVDFGESFSTTWRTRVQLRTTFTETPEDSTVEVQLRTLRLFNQGHILTRKLRYVIQLALASRDFEADSSSPVFDAFLDWEVHRDFRVRVGQYFVPLDRARTIREFALHFADRQTAVRELTLDRDVGVMFWSEDLFGWGWLGYHLFVGGGDGRNRFEPKSHGPLVIGRLVARPMGLFDDDQEGDLTRGAAPRLAIGVGGGYNHQTQRIQSTYGKTLTSGHIDYWHGAVDLVFKYQGFYVLAEGLIRKATNRLAVVETEGEAAVEQSRDGAGYLVHFGYMLTDALEVAARWEQTFALGDTSPSLEKLETTGGDQFAAAVNYYLNGHLFKLQADYSMSFGDVVQDATHIIRLQLDASF